MAQANHRQLKALHDLMVAARPGGAEHPHCALCDEEDTLSTTTEDQLAAAVATAVATATAPLQARIDELESAAGQAAQDTAIAEAVAAATAPLAEQVDSLRSDLDAAVARAVAAENTLNDTVAFLSAEAETAAAVAVQETRVDEVRQTGIFDEAHLEANSARWAAMASDMWESTIGEYRAMQARYDTQPPAATPPVPSIPAPLKATAEDGAKPESAARKAMRLRGQGINLAAMVG